VDQTLRGNLPLSLTMFFSVVMADPKARPLEDSGCDNPEVFSPRFATFGLEHLNSCLYVLPRRLASQDGLEPVL
jgi:hypothetical protein